MRIALASVAGLGLAVGSATAAPEVVVEGGSTFAIHGVPDDGGPSLSVAALWAVLPRVSFGVMAFADDLGAEISDLRDPNDGTWIGRAETAHRNTFGGAWRADVELADLGGWRPLASASWGYYRVQDDHRGKTSAALSSTGFSLGATLARVVTPGHALGVGVRYHRLFNDVAGRYLSLGLEWRYAPGTRTSPPGTTER